MVPEQQIRILLADDHTLFRQGLRRIFELEDDLVVIGEAVSGLDVVEQVMELRPDVVIMDINMPDFSGVVATERLKKFIPKVKILILSIHDDEAYIFEAIRSGANGYLLKDVESHEFVHAVREVASGSGFIHPQVTTKILDEFKRLSHQVHESAAWGSVGTMSYSASQQYAAPCKLTQRELQILQLMSEGKSNRAIGEAVFISEKTVKNHISSIFIKLGVDDRSQAVIIALKKGWVHL